MRCVLFERLGADPVRSTAVDSARATSDRHGLHTTTSGQETRHAASTAAQGASGAIKAPPFEVGKADSAEKVVLRGGEAGSRFAGLAKRRVF